MLSLTNIAVTDCRSLAADLPDLSTSEGFNQDPGPIIELTTVADNASRTTLDVQATESRTIDPSMPALEVAVQALEIFGATAFKNGLTKRGSATTGHDTATVVDSSDTGCRARWPIRMCCPSPCSVQSQKILQRCRCDYTVSSRLPLPKIQKLPIAQTEGILRCSSG